MDSRKKERDSSLEIVKIIAIICIVFCHSIPAERIEYHFATSDPWLFVVMMFRQLGSVGNAIFMVASTWFLVDSDKTNLRKMKQMIADNQMVSLICLGAIWGGYSLSIKIAIKQVFPFLFGTLWYITCYVLYYCLHGFANRSLRGLSIKPKLPLICVVLFDIVVWVIGGLYFTELVGFLMVHVFTWYVKELLRSRTDSEIIKLGKQILLIGLLGWIFGAIAFNLVGLKISFVGSKFHYWNRFYNPFILSMAYGMILIASQKKLFSVSVNKLSGLSLYIYMFTGNQLLRIYPDNSLYDLVVEWFGSSMMVCSVFVVGYSFVKSIFGIGISVLYTKTIGIITKSIVNRECDWISDKLQRFGCDVDA